MVLESNEKNKPKKKQEKKEKREQLFIGIRNGVEGRQWFRLFRLFSQPGKGAHFGVFF